MTIAVLIAVVGLGVGFAVGVAVVLRSDGFFQRLSALTHTLGSPLEKGTWGETRLRQLVELAGMERWCDFDEQVGLPNRGGVLDMVVRVPGHRRLIVDSKGTFDAKGLRTQMRDLAAKRYWEKLPESLDFVVLFVPAESALGAALQEDPSLLKEAAGRNVMFATPTTLLTILRFLAAAWRWDMFARHAEDVRASGEQLYLRAGTWMGHMGKVGKHLGQTVEAFNSLLGSTESRLVPSLRRIHQLGIGAQEIEPVAPVDGAVREFRPRTTELMCVEQEQGLNDVDDELTDGWTLR